MVDRNPFLRSTSTTLGSGASLRDQKNQAQSNLTGFSQPQISQELTVARTGQTTPVATRPVDTTPSPTPRPTPISVSQGSTTTPSNLIDNQTAGETSGIGVDREGELSQADIGTALGALGSAIGAFGTGGLSIGVGLGLRAAGLATETAATDSSFSPDLTEALANSSSFGLVGRSVSEQFTDHLSKSPVSIPVEAVNPSVTVGIIDPNPGPGEGRGSEGGAASGDASGQGERGGRGAGRGGLR